MFDITGYLFLSQIIPIFLELHSLRIPKKIQGVQILFPAIEKLIHHKIHHTTHRPTQLNLTVESGPVCVYIYICLYVSWP